MVTTRRQSSMASGSNGAIPGAQSAGAASASASVKEHCLTAKAEAKARPTKRRKTTKMSPSTVPGGSANALKAQSPLRQGRPDLSLVLTMPLDIIYEILAQTTLSDLVNVGRANQSWRKILRGAHAAFIWKTVRQAGQYPEPPEDFTEQQWANMLLGKTCQTCGNTKHAMGWRDWFLLRIVCHTCRRKHLIDERTILGRRFSTISKDILNYVSHTNQSGWEYHRLRQFYWDEDIIRISAERDAIEDPEARRAWELKRAAALQKHREMVPKYKSWQHGVWKAEALQEQRDREARLKAVKARFMDMGYAQDDVDRALVVWLPGIQSGSPNVSNAAWARIRPKLQIRVQAQVNRRLAEALKTTVEERMKILEGVYMSYLGTLRPSERLFCPPVEVLRPVPDILELIEAPKEIEITAETFSPLERNFGRYISELQTKLKDTLKAEAKQHARQSFELASVVFRRKHRRMFGCRTRGFSTNWTTPGDMVIVGWSMIGTHSTSYQSHEQLRDGVWIPMPAGFEFNGHVSSWSAKLVRLAGLDPKTATVAEMDARDPRFVHTAFMTEIGYPVLTWRAALSLFDAFLGQNKGTDRSFRLATPEEESQAKANEMSLRASAKAWSCNHCHEFLSASQAESKTFILEHLASRHSIIDATAPDDYFVNERCRHTYEVPFEIAIPDRNEDLYKCSCLRCRQAVVEKRRYTWKGLEEHFAWTGLRHPAVGLNYALARARTAGVEV